MMSVNVTGAFLGAREAFRRMATQTPRGGRIINNGSISAYVPRPQSLPYTVSKHAITGLTRSLSLEGRAYDIACGQIDIGNAATRMTTGIATGSLQAGGNIAAEPTMDVDHVATTVVHMAGLPLSANIQFLTVMATKMLSLDEVDGSPTLARVSRRGVAQTGRALRLGRRCRRSDLSPRPEEEFSSLIRSYFNVFSSITHTLLRRGSTALTRSPRPCLLTLSLILCTLLQCAAEQGL